MLKTLIWPFVLWSILPWTGYSEAIEEDAVPGYAVFSVYDKETNNWDQMGAAAINLGAKSTGPKELRRLSGKMMTAPFNVYLIFYGRGWKPDVVYRLQHFVKKLDQTKYFGVLKSYQDENGSINGPVILNETIWTDYEMGQKLDDSDLKRYIARLYPVVDPNGIYIVLTDMSVTVSLDKYNFCNQFCGYHSIVFENSGNRKYGYVGDASACGSCTPENDTPNLDLSVDGTASILAHEIIEAIVNPDTTQPAFLDEDGLENADKCSFSFGRNNPRDANGNRYNLVAGSLKYRIQQMWSLLSDSCVMEDP